MKHWLILLSFLVSVLEAAGQDVAWLVDQAPMVSGLTAQILEKSPSFVANVNVSVSGKINAVPSAASGRLRSDKGHLRWEAKLGDIKSEQLTPSAKAIVKQLNGDRIVVVTRSDEKLNCLVLSGAGAYLSQPFSRLPLSPIRSQPGTELLDGQRCVREKRTARLADGHSIEVTLWRAKDLKNVPIQIQAVDSGETFTVRLTDVRFQGSRPEDLKVPPGLAKYDTMEDLMQSVLIAKMKRRLGLE